MSKGWQIGGSPRRSPGVVCHNSRCKFCETATFSCRINCAACADRLDKAVKVAVNSGKGVKRGKSKN